MIAVAAVSVAFSTVDDAVPAGTDAEWGVPLISPGAQADDSTRYRGWRQLWVENKTNQPVDIGVIATVTSVTGSPVILSAVKTTILKGLLPGAGFTWTFPAGEALSGPIYCRFTAAPEGDAGTVNAGGFVE